MKSIIYIIVSFVLVIFTSCETVFMNPNPSTDNKAIFDEYATLVKEKYAMLAFKQVDIDFLKDSIGATISNNTTESELFYKLGYITEQLKDGHSALDVTDSETLHIGFDLLKGYPVGFDLFLVIDNYLAKDIGAKMEIFEGGELGIRAIYGVMEQKDNIGYFHLPTFDTEITDAEIETMFKAVKDTKGLIIDVRGNGGGDPSLSTKFASYLTDKEVYTGFERFKTGPGKSDFSDSKVFLQPANSDLRYTKPVAVLTDRGCYSATTTFSYSVYPMENVKFFGQRTGGGSGSVADGFLANGWKWSLSTSEFIDHLDRHLDNGFDPHFPVLLDTTNMIDEVIEKALIELK